MDGNLQVLKRYDQSNHLVDNFNYTYYSGNNRLQNIGAGSDYTYDNNGNVTLDDLNKNTGFKYDWRNLMIENTNVLSLQTFRTYYRYDEAGNRINKKQYLYVLGSPPGGEGGPGGDSIIVDEGDFMGYWAMVGNTYYVRDVGGKEIAIYNSGGLVQWNLWGLDQVGHMNADTTKYYYLKDHLGSTRAVINSTNTVVSSQDYDAWGYMLENRTYQPENSKYKFTGKERDKDLENNYDYFGARYYDSRIANWLSVDPLLEKHFDYTPYNYVLRSPLKFIDPEGKQIWFAIAYEITQMAAIASTVYAGYQIYKIYESYNTTTFSPEATQEKVETTQDANVSNPYYESRNKIKKEKIEGAVEVITKHLEKISTRTPQVPDPDKDKTIQKWIKDIKRAVNNLKKEAGKLKKDPQDVIKELINKGKLNQEQMTKMGEQLKKLGIE